MLSANDASLVKAVAKPSSRLRRDVVQDLEHRRALVAVAGLAGQHVDGGQLARGLGGGERVDAVRERAQLHARAADPGLAPGEVGGVRLVALGDDLVRDRVDRDVDLATSFHRATSRSAETGIEARTESTRREACSTTAPAASRRSSRSPVTATARTSTSVAPALRDLDAGERATRRPSQRDGEPAVELALGLRQRALELLERRDLRGRLLVEIGRRGGRCGAQGADHRDRHDSPPTRHDIPPFPSEPPPSKLVHRSDLVKRPTTSEVAGTGRRDGAWQRGFRARWRCPWATCGQPCRAVPPGSRPRR